MPATRRIAAVVAGPALVVLLAATAAAGPTGSSHARGAFINASGAEIGWVKLSEDRTGVVHVNVKVEGMTPGLHGIHMHAVGSCTTTATAFDGAGGHFNPFGHQHGLDNPAGPHAGDLPNLVVDADGSGTLNAKTELVSLGAGTTSLLDANGSAFIIHANQDDQVSDVANGGPANGGSGARVACAVIVAD
jgi:Cu-Zn family superoxide dismutase